jgi:O-antigen biosynthesis protein
MEKIKTIAFYLPQFHQIPENDKWWGEGFTEWTNVKKAKPLFGEHYQPHIPNDDLGYYDLSDIEVQKKQVELAKKYDIGGFCYYHYWFDGKKLLETPLKNILNHPEIDFPFCICWANENWTRRWDGDNKEILIAQNHSDEDDLAFIRDSIKILKDERYVKINGKPLVLIYRPALLPDSKKTMRIWREEAMKNGISDLYIVRVENFDRNIPPSEFGCDAAVKFAPNFDVCNYDRVREKPLASDYDTLVAEDITDCHREYKLFKAVCPSWDNAARRQDCGGVSFINSSPKKYEYWLGKVIEYTLHTFKEDERLVFINAWNEWGEGAHLEPDKKYGYKWLDATKKALAESDKLSKDHFLDYEYKIFDIIRKEKTKFLEITSALRKNEAQTIHQKDEYIESLKWTLERKEEYIKEIEGSGKKKHYLASILKKIKHKIL